MAPPTGGVPLPFSSMLGNSVKTDLQMQPKRAPTAKLQTAWRSGTPGPQAQEQKSQAHGRSRERFRAYPPQLLGVLGSQGSVAVVSEIFEQSYKNNAHVPKPQARRKSEATEGFGLHHCSIIGLIRVQILGNTDFTYSFQGEKVTYVTPENKRDP